MMRTGVDVPELMQRVENLPEPLRNRFWIYVNNGGR